MPRPRTPPLETGMKRCRRCGIEKSIRENFYAAGDGKAIGTCIACMRRYQLAYRQGIIAELRRAEKCPKCGRAWKRRRPSVSKAGGA